MVTLEQKIEGHSKKPEFELKDLATAEEYLDWKKTVPFEVRRVVETVLKGNKLQPSQIGLALSDQFLNALGESLASGEQVDLSGADERVFNLLDPLRRIETKGGHLNVFETLRNPDVSWNLKSKIFEMQIKPALDWLAERDLEK